MSGTSRQRPARPGNTTEHRNKIASALERGGPEGVSYVLGAGPALFSPPLARGLLKRGGSENLTRFTANSPAAAAAKLAAFRS